MSSRSSAVGSAALGVAEMIEAATSAKSAEFAGRSGCLAPGVTTSAARMRRGAAEDDEIDERIRAETIGTMHGDAGRLADRHEAGDDDVGIARPS